VAELDRLRAQIANATSVASVPVKAMQDKLNAIEEESRGLRMQTDKAAADASQFLVKKAVDVAKAERAKAAAQRELKPSRPSSKWKRRASKNNSRRSKPMRMR
jgi:hypothetical protein